MEKEFNLDNDFECQYNNTLNSPIIEVMEFIGNNSSKSTSLNSNNNVSSYNDSSKSASIQNDNQNNSNNINKNLNSSNKNNIDTLQFISNESSNNNSIKYYSGNINDNDNSSLFQYSKSPSFYHKKVSMENNCSNENKDDSANKQNESIISFKTKIQYKNDNTIKTAEIIKEINDHILNVGNKNIYIFKSEDEKQAKIDTIEDRILNFEKYNDDKVILCTKNKIFFYKLQEKPEEILKKLKDKNLNFMFKIDDKDNSYALCHKDKVSIIKYLKEKYEERNHTIISNDYYREGISINKDIFALVSNSIISRGKDILTIYDIKKKKDIKMFKGSFIFSSTGLKTLLYKNKNKSDNKSELFLLCACKKYIKGQKNGILLIYNFNSEKVNIKHKFFPTDKFEVHCFCQILDLSNPEHKLKPELNYINYFFVGGFDIAKNKGSIKLYKINKIKKNNEEIFELEIIQDIVIPKTGNFKGFKGAISCIEQSQKNKNIYITSWNGNVFLFKNLWLSKFLENPTKDTLFNFYN